MLTLRPPGQVSGPGACPGGADLLGHDAAGLLVEGLVGEVLVGVEAVEGGEGLVEADVDHQGLEGAQGGGGGGAPVGEVGELPPPQGLGGTARAVVGHAVAQVGHDVGEAVGDAGRDRGGARLVGVEDLGVDVDGGQQGGVPLAQFVHVGLGAQVRLVPLLGEEVGVSAEAAAGQQQLGELEQEEGDGAVRLVTLGDLDDRDQEGFDLVGDLDGEVVGVLRGGVERGVRHRGVVSLRRRGPE